MYIMYRGTSAIRNVLHKKQSVLGVSRLLIIKKRTPGETLVIFEQNHQNLVVSEQNLVIFEQKKKRDTERSH